MLQSSSIIVYDSHSSRMGYSFSAGVSLSQGGGVAGDPTSLAHDNINLITMQTRAEMCFYRVYSIGEFAGLKLAVFDHLSDVLVNYKGISPYILVCFLPRFGLISGGSKIGVKKAEIRQ